MEAHSSDENLKDSTENQQPIIKVELFAKEGARETLIAKIGEAGDVLPGLYENLVLRRTPDR